MVGWTRILERGRPALAALRAAASDPRAAQLRLLAKILAANAGSAFGREHGFDAISGCDDFRARVSIRDYDGFLPWIERIRGGEKHALTDEAPIAFEETGGSSGGRRLIPYPPAALEAFGRTVLAWLADLLEDDPRIAEGRAYFAVSPATRAARRLEGGLPVGLESDAAYFGSDLAADVAAVTVGATALPGIADFSEWRERTLACLAAAGDLTLVSVWSPTFLTALLDALERDPEPVLRRLRDGEPERARLLAECMRSGKLDTARLWPGLRLVSAWADAGSARFAGPLRARFPHARFQPKGLLATEGAFTVPLTEAALPLPALTSAFLEFEGGDGRMRLVDEVEVGGDYGLVVTTPGGLYRYRIGDVVRCAGFHRAEGARVPMLVFTGRAGNTCDLVGEKLEEGFVAACLAQNVEGFAALAPADDPQPGYLLLLERRLRFMPQASSPPSALPGISPSRGEIGQSRACKLPISPLEGEMPGRAEGGEWRHRPTSSAIATVMLDVAAAVDQALSANPLYADARRLGQLAPVRPVLLRDPLGRYCAWRMAKGHRLGDIKPPVLMASFQAAFAVWPELSQAEACDSLPGT